MKEKKYCPSAEHRLGPPGETPAFKEVQRTADHQADLEARAKQGDTEAIIELAVLTGNLPQLKAMAESGNSEAAYALFEPLSGDRETTIEAWRWLCKSANAADGKAQEKVGFWHSMAVWLPGGGPTFQWYREEVGIQPDNRIAYMWYALADSNGDSNASDGREFVKADMTPEDIVQAEQMVRDWKPGQCPRP